MLDQLFKQINWEVERKYEGLAIALQNHIKYDYIPKGWRKSERIGTVFGFASINGQNARDFLEAYLNGPTENLEQTLENYEDERFRKYPCFRAAVRDFFEQGKHKEFIANSLLEEELKYMEESANAGAVQIMECSLTKFKKLAKNAGEDISQYGSRIEKILETGYSNGINRKLKDAEQLAKARDECKTLMALNLVEKYSLAAGRDAPQDIYRILEILIKE